MSADELTLELAKTAAKNEHSARLLHKGVEDRAEHATGFGPWRFKPGEAKRAHLRNVEYLKRAIENVERVVHLHVSDLNPVVRDQVVAEQTRIIERAAIEDHTDNKDLAEDVAGPKVKAAIQVVEQADFSNALKFCQKPWWEASSTMLTS